MLVRSVIPFFCLLLGACSDWPDVAGPDLSRSGPFWPDLVPIGSVTDVPASLEADPAAEAQALADRAADLQRRAALLRRPVEDDGAFDALREAIRTP